MSAMIRGAIGVGRNFPRHTAVDFVPLWSHCDLDPGRGRVGFAPDYFAKPDLWRSK